MKKLLGTAALIAFCSPAFAETLDVAGIYNAGADIDFGIQTIIVDEFGGDAGPELSFALSGALAEVQIYDQNWFAILPTAISGTLPLGEGAGQVSPNSIAILQGMAQSSIDRHAAEPKEVWKCTKREDGACVKRETFTYKCRVLTVSYRPSIRLVGADGVLIYQDSDEFEEQRKYCFDEDDRPDPDKILNSLAAEYSYAVRLDLAPQYRAEQIRILEGRKGMSREDAQSFRQAVKLTKSDAYAACLAFDALENTNPEHVSVSFNIGLCHESEGNLEAAGDYYRRALEVSPGKIEAQSGLDRIASKSIARQQVLEHFPD